MMKKTLSLLCCLLMLLQLFSVTALAAEGEVVENPEGAVNVSTESGNADVVVNGDINSTEGGPALDVNASSGEGMVAVVTVNGDVTASASENNWANGVSASAMDGRAAFATVNGDVTVKTGEGYYAGGVNAYADNEALAAVAVNGDVTSDGEGIRASTYKDSLAIAEVDGDVKSGYNGASAWGENAIAAVSGDVTASDGLGVSVGNGGRVYVGGDVTGGVQVAGYSSDDSDDASNGLVVVEGTVKRGKQDYALTVDSEFAFDQGGKLVQYDIDTNVIPVIEVGKLEANKDGKFFGATKYEAQEITEEHNGETFTYNVGVPVYISADEATEQYLKENVRYLVSEDMAAGEMNVDGTKQSEQTGSDYALEDDTLTVKLSLAPGYRLDGLKAGEYADVKQNADGTYTVTVKRGGDLNLQALLAAAMFKTEYAEAELFGAKPGDSLDDAMRAVAATFRGNKKIRFDTMNSLIVGAELKAFNKLDGEQKLLVMMNLLKLAIGQDVNTEGLSKEAAALVTKLAERLGAMSAEARLAKLSKLIQVKDGKAVIDLRIGATHQRFSFNAEDGSFISAENGAFVLKGYDRLY